MTRPWLFNFAGKKFPQRWEVTFLLGGKRVQYVWTETPTGRLRESVPELCPRGSVNYYNEASLPAFLWLVIMVRPVHSPYLVYLRILLCVRTCLLAKMDSTAEVYAWSIS